MGRVAGFALVFLGVSAVMAIFARLVLLPIALWLQKRYRLSDEFVTELSVGFPLAILVASYAAWFAWLWQ